MANLHRGTMEPAAGSSDLMRTMRAFPSFPTTMELGLRLVVVWRDTSMLTGFLVISYTLVVTSH